MRHLVPLLIASLIALPVAAHDMWLQPTGFWLAAPGVVAITPYVGHGPDRDRWSVAASRVVRFQSIGPTGLPRDQRPRLTPALNRDIDVLLTEPGTNVVVLESSNARSDLPAVRFNAYARDEGLTLAIQERIRRKTTGRPGREIYSRRAKTLVQVGPVNSKPQPQVTRPLGQTLEIVPERSPYAIGAGRTFPVRVYYQGRPLAGALVRLHDLGADARPVQTLRTDAAGRAVFAARTVGSWQLNVVWSRPLAGNSQADFETVFSSLTWGFTPQVG